MAAELSPLCKLCKHLMRDKSKHRGKVPDHEYFLSLHCAAYPNGVPSFIRDWGGHFTPKPGDNGIVFEPDERIHMTPIRLESYKRMYPDKDPDSIKRSA